MLNDSNQIKRNSFFVEIIPITQQQQQQQTMTTHQAEGGYGSEIAFNVLAVGSVTTTWY